MQACHEQANIPPLAQRPSCGLHSTKPSAARIKSVSVKRRIGPRRAEGWVGDVGARRGRSESWLQPEWVVLSEYLGGNSYFGGVGTRGRVSKSQLRVHGRTLGLDRSGARHGSKTESDWTRMKLRREGLFDIRTWLPTVHVVNYLYGSVASPNTETKVRERVSTSEHR